MSQDKILPFTGAATIAILESLALLIDVSFLIGASLDDADGEWYDLAEELNNWKGVLASQLREVKSKHGVPVDGSRSQNRDSREAASRREPPNRVGPVRTDRDGDSKHRPTRWRGEVPPSEANFEGLLEGDADPEG